MAIEYEPKNNLKKAIDRETIVHKPDRVMADILAEQAKVRVLRPATKKKPMTIRLDEDCLDAWRSTGRDWQGRMNAYLRKGVGM
jgi:uncharacterized protein (DUF4415 family)